MRENNITRIDRNMLTGLASLERLDLTDNPYTDFGSTSLSGKLTLAADAFADVTGLTELELSSNYMTSIPSGVFSRLTSLKKLDLSNNSLQQLSSNLFEDLDELEVLDLYQATHSTLTALDEDLFDGLDNLEELSLSGNHLEALPSDIFDGLVNLEDLSFHSNEITQLPEDLFDDLDNLEQLYFGYNQIALLPDGLFTELSSLWIVSADGNTGAPFDITVELESRETDDGNEVYATVATGAPFPITVTLSVEDGDGTTDILSTSTLTVPAGGTESNAATITSNDDYPNAAAVIDSLAFDTPAPPSGVVYNGDQVLGLNLVSRVPPMVSDLEITSEPPSTWVTTPTYGIGDEIEFTVSFSKDVSVTGTPRLRFALGTFSKWATYDSVDGSQVTFTYTVVYGDNGSIGVAADSLALNGGTIQDSDGYAARLQHNAIAEDLTQYVFGFIPNNAATGAPTISGTAQVGQTLTASTTGISDSDGLTNVTYSYQWLADDAEIDGATSSTYTVQSTDNGKVIKVRVTFDDDAGYEESLTSAGTSAVVLGGL